MLSPRWMFFYPACLMLAAGAFFMATPVVYQGWFGAYTMLFGAAGLVCGSQSVVFAFTARLFYRQHRTHRRSVGYVDVEPQGPGKASCGWVAVAPRGSSGDCWQSVCLGSG